MWWRRQWLPLAITWTGAVAVEVTAATPRGGRAGTDGEGGRATGHGSGAEGGKNTASSFLSSSSPSSNPPSRCRHRPPQRSGHAATVEVAGVRLLLLHGAQCPRSSPRRAAGGGGGRHRQTYTAARAWRDLSRDAGPRRRRGCLGTRWRALCDVGRAPGRGAKLELEPVVAEV